MPQHSAYQSFKLLDRSPECSDRRLPRTCFAGMLHSFFLNFQSADEQGKLVNKYMRTLVRWREQMAHTASLRFVPLQLLRCLAILTLVTTAFNLAASDCQS